MDALRIILHFTLLIGPLVFLHELGHLLMARRFGVRCHEFAIGFGPRIASWRPGETEYSFRLLPLGGYVRMLGAVDGEHIAEGDRGRALTDKPIWQRFLIYLAGPAMNLLIPIPVFALFTFLGPGDLPATVGTVEPGMAAAEAGLQPGDRITAVDGRSIRSFDQLQRRIARRAGQPVEVEVLRGEETLSLTVTPAASVQRDRLLPMRTVERGMIGVHMAGYGPVAHVRGPNTDAWQAGFRTFDMVRLIDGDPVDSWAQVVERLQVPGNHTVTVLRGQPLSDAFGDVRLRIPVRFEFESTGSPELQGLVDARQTLHSVQPGSPAAAAGLAPGDRVLALDGRPISDLSWAINQLSLTPGVTRELHVERAGEPLVVSVTPEERTVVAEFRTQRSEVFVGMVARSSYTYPDPERRGTFSRMAHSVASGFRDTASLILALLYGVVFLFTGQLDSASMGGPLMIADAASQAARAGWDRFVGMMALISINLGVLNLLPIPGLDGGQLAVLTLEGVKRGPLSMRTRQIIQYIGVAMILLLMVFVFKNDIERYWSGIANWLNS